MDPFKKKIVSIKASLNKGLSDNLNVAFPGTVPVLIPKVEDRKISDLHWLAGFTEAEGCFFVATKESPLSKLGETVWLKFLLTHSRDEQFIKSLITIFGCGRYVPRSTRDYGEFIVEKFSDINGKIVPFFEEFQLHGIKRKNFDDFKKVSQLMQNKAHLTSEDLVEIKKIKSGMNKKR